MNQTLGNSWSIISFNFIFLGFENLNVRTGIFAQTLLQHNNSRRFIGRSFFPCLQLFKKKKISYLVLFKFQKLLLKTIRFSLHYYMK